MSSRSRACSCCSAHIKTVLALALTVQRRLALFFCRRCVVQQSRVCYSGGGGGVCLVMACEIAVKREASNLVGTSLVTVRCQREST